jgi:hypothetical protein
MKIRKFYNRENKTKEFEVFTSPSKTVPDQTLSIPELIQRYASGLPLGGSKVPSYSEDPENDILQGRDFRTLDLSEQHELIQAASDEIKEISKRSYRKKPTPKEGGEKPTNENPS